MTQQVNWSTSPSSSDRCKRRNQHEITVKVVGNIQLIYTDLIWYQLLNFPWKLHDTEMGHGSVGSVSDLRRDQPARCRCSPLPPTLPIEHLVVRRCGVSDPNWQRAMFSTANGYGETVKNNEKHRIVRYSMYRYVYRYVSICISICIDMYRYVYRYSSCESCVSTRLYGLEVSWTLEPYPHDPTWMEPQTLDFAEDSETMAVSLVLGHGMGRCFSNTSNISNPGWTRCDVGDCKIVSFNWFQITTIVDLVDSFVHRRWFSHVLRVKKYLKVMASSTSIALPALPLAKHGVLCRCQVMPNGQRNFGQAGLLLKIQRRWFLGSFRQPMTASNEYDISLTMWLPSLLQPLQNPEKIAAGTARLPMLAFVHWDHRLDERVGGTNGNLNTQANSGSFSNVNDACWNAGCQREMNHLHC